ncbi:hypothetical protein AALP_AA1G099700 [Arabis alpina]|uniref:Uncharacterized protein n=1 Tax=Arabis alpina TaxID=50452 RepID=A0A087HMA1_ARAAL|nr:hypothetical protein AALP_AA1G099700 [Arabis alpina]
MNLPSSTATPTSTSSPSDTSANSTETCQDCRSIDSWVIHTVRLRTQLRFFCTHCLLKNHPTSFCPSCFVFYDSSPPHPSRRVTCSNSKCQSLTHIQCSGDVTSPSSSYLCPPCRNPDSFSFFRPIIGQDGVRSVDKSLSEAFFCAAKIASSSMNKAVSAARCDAERRCREAALAKKRAREALEDVVTLDAKEKTRSVIPKLKEACIEISREQKPKLNGAVKEIESSGVIKNNGGVLEKQSSSSTVTLAKVKQEGDASR